MLSLLYSLTLTSIHDYQKHHSFDYMDLLNKDSSVRNFSGDSCGFVIFSLYYVGTEQCLLEGWDDAGKMNLSSLLVWLVSSCFYLTVLLRFLKWTPELSQSCFCS